MTKPVYSAYHQYIEIIFRKALKAVDPYRLISRSLRNVEGKLHLGETTIDPSRHPNSYLIAIGKAAGGMTRAFLEISKLQPRAGIIALPTSDPTTFPHPFTVFHAGHPHPTQVSIEAGLAAKKLLKKCGSEEIVWVLISGGGSALFELPVPGIELGDLLQINELLLQSGLSIKEVNIIRGALSQVKAGGLARMAHPARVVSLIISDVIGDPLGSIASGPTVLSPDRRHVARRLLLENDLWSKLPTRIHAVLNQTRPRRARTHRPTNNLIGGNQQLIDGAVGAAQSLGFNVKVLSRQMHGEARHIGQKFAKRLVKLSAGIKHPTCFIMGGETTVTVQGPGKGGRNQELALSSAGILKEQEQIVLTSLASDGIDGPTDAAGGVIDGKTYTRITSSGFDLELALDQNDSYAALQNGNALFHTGPTGTNVADLTLGLIFPKA
jgi:hydroxypyruvate reductase